MPICSSLWGVVFRLSASFVIHPYLHGLVCHCTFSASAQVYRLRDLQTRCDQTVPNVSIWNSRLVLVSSRSISSIEIRCSHIVMQAFGPTRVLRLARCILPSYSKEIVVRTSFEMMMIACSPNPLGPISILRVHWSDAAIVPQRRSW